MSMRADIESCFKEIANKTTVTEFDLLVLKFEVYQSLDWDDAAGDVVREILGNGYEIDGNMRCYLEQETE